MERLVDGNERCGSSGIEMIRHVMFQLLQNQQVRDRYCQIHHKMSEIWIRTAQIKPTKGTLSVCVPPEFL